MSGIFENCETLNDLNLSSFDTKMLLIWVICFKNVKI